MHIDTGFADINGARLYYEAAGAGMPLVFMHGFTLDTRMWDDQFEPFAAQYRVIRYDLRGYGRSSLPTSGAYSHADDLRALLDHLAIPRAHIVALSMGGGRAINFAIAHPQRIAALTLIGSMLPGCPFSPTSSAQMKLVYERARAAGIAAARETWLAHDLFAHARSQPAVFERLARMVDDYSGWHFVHRDPEQGLTPAAAQRLPELTAPTLILLGEHDIPDVHDYAALITREAPCARSVVLPGAGHMANMEAPAVVNGLIAAFLAGMPPDKRTREDAQDPHLVRFEADGPIPEPRTTAASTPTIHAQS